MKLKNLANTALQKYRSFPMAAKASFWFIVCSIIQRGISFLTTPIFTRVMSTEQYGQVTLFNSWINVICIFTTLNLQSGSFNTAQIKFANDRKAYTSSVQGLVFVISGVALVLFALFGKYVTGFMERPVFMMLVMVIQINARFNTSLWMANCRFDFKYKAMTVVILLSCVLGQAASLLWVLNSQEKGYTRLIAVALVEVLFGLGITLYNQIQGKKFFSKQYWKYALGFNLPLVPYYLSQIIFSSSDRIMISNMVSVEKAGIYGLAYTVALLLSFVVTAIRNSYTPWFFKTVKAGDGNAIKRISTLITGAVAVMLMLFVFVAPELLLLMGGDAYMEAVWIIPPLVTGLLFEFFTDPACNVLFYYEKKGSLVTATVGCAVVNIILNYLGIKWLGYFATAYSTLISYILFWVFLYISAAGECRRNDMAPGVYLIPKAQALMGLACLGIAGGCMALYPYVYVRYGVLAALLIVAVCNYKKLLAVVQQIAAMRK